LRRLRSARIFKNNTENAIARFRVIKEKNERGFKMTPAKKHRGPTLDSVLKAEGVYDELKTVTVKEAISWQLEKAMAKKR
jgi:hypothetical protein